MEGQARLSGKDKEKQKQDISKYLVTNKEGQEPSEERKKRKVQKAS